MKKIFALIICILVPGCAPYSSRTNISDCLSTGNYSNNEITNKINNKKSIKIKNIKPVGGIEFEPNGDGTLCQAVATYENDTVSRGFVISNGRWSHPQSINYDFLTETEKFTKENYEATERQRAIDNAIKESMILAEQSNREFDEASSKEYPHEAEVYCYNKRTLEIYHPRVCGTLVLGETGPTNSYDKNALTLKLMLKEHFKLKVTIEEAHPFAGIKVDVRSRKTNKVINTKTGSFTDTIVISG